MLLLQYRGGGVGEAGNRSKEDAVGSCHEESEKAVGEGRECYLASDRGEPNIRIYERIESELRKKTFCGSVDGEGAWYETFGYGEGDETVMSSQEVMWYERAAHGCEQPRVVKQTSRRRGARRYECHRSWRILGHRSHARNV